MLSSLICFLILLLQPQSQAAITRVNTGTGTADASAATIATAATNHTAGNMILVFVAHESASNAVTSVTNTAGDTFVSDASCKVTFTSIGKAEFWWVASTAGNASDVVTANFTASVGRRIVAIQYSGAHATSPLDVCNTSTQSAGPGTFVSGSISPTSGDTAIFCSDGDGATTYSASGSYSAFVTALGTNVGCEDLANVSSGSQTATFNLTNAVNTWGVIISIKVAGSAAASPTLTLLGAGR